MDEKQADSLTPRQSRVISILIQARTVEEGAKLAGVSKTSIYSWLRKPLFREELSRRKNELMDVAIEDLKTHVQKAVAVLGGLLSSDSEGYVVTQRMMLLVMP
jgi:transposase